MKSRSGSRTRRLLSLIWVIRSENYGQETNYFILSFLEIFFLSDVTRNDSQQRFLAQHSVATLLLHCFEWLHHCSNIGALRCAKNRRCESYRVTSPLHMM